jgi:hypothetical protein
MPPCISYIEKVKKSKKNMSKIKFMKNKKTSSMYNITMNISSLNGDSLEDGAPGCTT